jgi:hypothetical protein
MERNILTFFGQYSSWQRSNRAYEAYSQLSRVPGDFGFRWFWKRKSKRTSPKPKLASELIILIKEMAKNNRLWGAERIGGELLKLDIHVCKRTIQKYMRHVRITRPTPLPSLASRRP